MDDYTTSGTTEYVYTADGIECSTEAGDYLQTNSREEERNIPGYCYYENIPEITNTESEVYYNNHNQSDQQYSNFEKHHHGNPRSSVQPENFDYNDQQMYIHEFQSINTNFPQQKPNRMKEVFKRHKENTESRLNQQPVNNSSTGIKSIDSLAMKLAKEKDGTHTSVMHTDAAKNTKIQNQESENSRTCLKNGSDNSKDSIYNESIIDDTHCFSTILKEIYEKSLVKNKLLIGNKRVLPEAISHDSNFSSSFQRQDITNSGYGYDSADDSSSKIENDDVETSTSGIDDENHIILPPYSVNDDPFIGQEITKEKYEYFSRNVEMFMSRDIPIPKRRKLNENESTRENQEESVSDNLNNEVGSSASEKGTKDQDEYTRKGYAKYFQCDLCNRKFSQVGHLNRHMRIHTGDKPFKCSVCGKEFSQSSDKCRHERTHTTFRPYQCFICDKEFNQSGHLQRHLSVHASQIHYKDGQFDKELTRKKYQEEKAAAADKTKKCPLCDKTFIKKYLLDRHVRSHTGETPYKCEECGKEFTRKDRLTTHIRIHSGEKPYTCKECGRGFNQGSHLKTHIRIHTGEKPYKCGICGRGFAQSHDKKKHERVHTGERPYVCPLCGKDFNDNSQLWRHARTHDDVEQEEGACFKCHVCSQEYSCTSQLLQHIKVHMVDQTAHQAPDLEVTKKHSEMDVRITAEALVTKNHSEMEDVRMTAEALVKETLVIDNNGSFDMSKTRTNTNSTPFPKLERNDDFENDTPKLFIVEHSGNT